MATQEHLSSQQSDRIAPSSPPDEAVPLANTSEDVTVQEAPLPLSPHPIELSDPTMKVATLSLATRRAACTHLTMERLYGDFNCNVCNKPSDFGWVYSCTQDDATQTIAALRPIVHPTKPECSGLEQDMGMVRGLGLKLDDELLSTFEIDSLEHRIPLHHPRPTKEFIMPSAQPNPWVEEAIQKGQYTPEQVLILRAQKQKVFELARTAIERFEQSQIKAQSEAVTTPQPLDTIPQAPFPLPEEVQETSQTIETPDAGEQQRQSPRPKTNMFPHCKFRACQLCRPTFRDRAWQCFEEVFAQDVPLSPLSLNDDDRPVASVTLLRRIGLRKPSLPKRPFLRYRKKTLPSPDQMTKPTISKNPHTQANLTTPQDSTDITNANVNAIPSPDLELESIGFRKSVSRGFRHMLMTRRRSSSSSTHSSTSARKRKATTREESGEDFDMNLWERLNDELLKEASSVPLPLPIHNEHSMGGLSEWVGEEDIIGGVAVTEESADLGVPDVIMAV